MKPPADRFDASVAAFRDLSAAESDGRATRARLLCALGQRSRRRGLVRRAAALAAGALVVTLFGSAAWTAWGRWRTASTPTRPFHAAQAMAPPSPGTAAPVGLTASPAEIDPPYGGPPPRGQPPRAQPRRGPEPHGQDPARTWGDDDAEERAYQRAHRAHFVEQDAVRALAAWDDYLRQYAGGVLAPEARYNRALCLVHLGRWAAAASALRPFARGRLDGYRQRDACALLAFIGRQSGAASAGAVELPSSCPPR